MIRSSLAFVFFVAGVVACSAQGVKTLPTGLTKKEVDDGWVRLFDGKTTNGWEKNSWKVKDGELVSPGDNSPLRASREYKDFELVLEFRNDRKKVATLGFGKYSERDSHPAKILLQGNHPGWQRLRLTVEGRYATGKIESIDVGKDPWFPENVIREQSSALVPLVFEGPNLRIRSIKIRHINDNPTKK